MLPRRGAVSVEEVVCEVKTCEICWHLTAQKCSLELEYKDHV